MKGTNRVVYTTSTASRVSAERIKQHRENVRRIEIAAFNRQQQVNASIEEF